MESSPVGLETAVHRSLIIEEKSSGPTAVKAWSRKRNRWLTATCHSFWMMDLWSVGRTIWCFARFCVNLVSPTGCLLMALKDWKENADGPQLIIYCQMTVTVTWTSEEWRRCWTPWAPVKTRPMMDGSQIAVKRIPVDHSSRKLYKRNKLLKRKTTTPKEKT